MDIAIAIDRWDDGRPPLVHGESFEVPGNGFGFVLVEAPLLYPHSGVTSLVRQTRAVLESGEPLEAIYAQTHQATSAGESRYDFLLAGIWQPDRGLALLNATWNAVFLCSENGAIEDVAPGHLAPGFLDDYQVEMGTIRRPSTAPGDVLIGFTEYFANPASVRESYSNDRLREFLPSVPPDTDAAAFVAVIQEDIKTATRGHDVLTHDAAVLVARIPA